MVNHRGVVSFWVDLNQQKAVVRTTLSEEGLCGAIVAQLQTSVNQDKLSAVRVRQVTSTICKVQEYVRAIAKLNLDDKEFAYLKAIALWTLIAAVSFSMASSGCYVLNDLTDAEADRKHPRKCRRPIAAGHISPGMARGYAAVLYLVAGGLAFLLPEAGRWWFLVC